MHKFLSIKEAFELLNVTTSTLRKWGRKIDS
jgi:DNA-binding transcriptional MerR regulator